MQEGAEIAETIFLTPLRSLRPPVKRLLPYPAHSRWRATAPGSGSNTRCGRTITPVASGTLEYIPAATAANAAAVFLMSITDIARGMMVSLVTANTGCGMADGATGVSPQMSNRG